MWVDVTGVNGPLQMLCDLSEVKSRGVCKCLFFPFSPTSLCLSCTSHMSSNWLFLFIKHLGVMTRLQTNHTNSNFGYKYSTDYSHHQVISIDGVTYYFPMQNCILSHLWCSAPCYQWIFSCISSWMYLFKQHFTAEFFFWTNRQNIVASINIKGSNSWIAVKKL
jgi:hypothetical protein